MSRKTESASTPTQGAILATAALRRNGHVLPSPDNVDAASATASKILGAMLAVGLVEDYAPIWRTERSQPKTGSDAMKAKVMPDGRISLPASLRKKHGLVRGGDVIVEDAGDAIILRTLDQVVARAQALSRALIGSRDGASVEDFLADRAREVEGE